MMMMMMMMMMMRLFTLLLLQFSSSISSSSCNNDKVCDGESEAIPIFMIPSMAGNVFIYFFLPRSDTSTFYDRYETSNVVTPSMQSDCGF